MKILMKFLSIIMAMTMMMLATCATDNSSDSNDSVKTGVVGKWKDSAGGIIEFRADGNVYDEYGSKIAEWTGNDVEGTVGFLQSDGRTWSLYNFSISGNNMTWSSYENANQRSYYTRA